jgi:hypothetical protein
LWPHASGIMGLVLTNSAYIKLGAP